MKKMIEYLQEAISSYASDTASQQKYLAVFFALIDVGMANEPIELLMQMGRGDAEDVNYAPYQGAMRTGEKLFYVFVEEAQRNFTDGLLTKNISVRQLCNLVEEEDTIKYVLFALASGESVSFSRDDIALLLQHLNSPIEPQSV